MPQSLVFKPRVIATGPTDTSHHLPGHMTAACVRTTTALEQLAGEWREFFQQIGCQNAFLCFDWMEPWWRQWGARHYLLVITVRNREGRLVAVAPFYVRRSRLGVFGPRALCFLGSQWVGSDHLDLLVNPEYEWAAIEAIVRIVEEHSAEWDYMELGDSAEDSRVLARFRQEFKTRGMTERVLRSSVCPYTPLPASFDEYLAGVGANLRYNFRRRQRAIKREAEIEFLTLRGGAELQDRFGEIVRLHRLRFEGQRKYSSFSTPEIQQFHAEALPRLAASGMARLYLLQANGKAIAALYGFSAGKKFAFYQCGMDPSWSRLSVGLVMMGCSIEEAIRTGHEEFDFLRGNEAYKFQWTTKSRRAATIGLFDRRVRSQCAQRYVWVRDRVKQLVRRYTLPVLGLLPLR